MAQTKDNAKAVEDFARALKQGSEEPTTFLNLATALENLGKGQDAETVLERGVAVYPYSGPLTANLAQHYVMDGQGWRARNLVEKYRALFPEDPALREVEKHLDAAGNAGQLTAPGQTAPVTAPR